MRVFVLFAGMLVVALAVTACREEAPTQNETDFVFPDIDLLDPDNQFDMVIVAPPTTHTYLSLLVSTRNQEGIRTAVITPEHINETFPQTSLREGISGVVAESQNRWQEPHTQYLLLVGSEAEIPAFRFRSRFANTPDSIEEYIDLDWPYALNIEDGDSLPDLAVGRIPFSDKSKLKNLLAKILSYPGPGFYKIMALSDADTANNNYYEQFADHFIDRVSDDVQKGRFDIRPDAPHAISPTAFLDSLARGTAYLNYFGLATPTSWSQSDFLNQSILQMLQNSRRPFFLYQFHQEGAVFSPILEALLTLEEGGACGAIVPTGYNYAYTTDQILNNVYMVLLNQNHPRIGDAFLTIQQSGFLRFPGNNQEIHRLRLVGDPSMPIPQF